MKARVLCPSSKFSQETSYAAVEGARKMSRCRGLDMFCLLIAPIRLSRRGDPYSYPPSSSIKPDIFLVLFVLPYIPLEPIACNLRPLGLAYKGEPSNNKMLHIHPLFLSEFY